MRYVPSVTFAHIFRFGFTNYAGLQASLIDVAAPAAEYALRPNVEYRGALDGGLAPLIDAFRPRIDFWLGLPRLTREVALTAGASLRTLRFNDCQPNNESKLCRTERGKADKSEQASHFAMYSFSGSLELNAGAMIFF